jgi:hypothetical protein
MSAVEREKDQLIATRLSPALAALVRREAEREMISTAAFIRRTLASAVREQRKV